MNYMEEYSRGIISILLRESPCGGFEWGYVIAGILANKNYIGLSSEIFMMRKQVRQIFFFRFFPSVFLFMKSTLIGPLEVEFLVRVNQKQNSVRDFHQLSSFVTQIFEVKKSEIY